MDDRSGNLLVLFALSNQYEIPMNSVAKIYSSDLMGTKSIELVLSDNIDNHISGDTIIGNIEGGLKEQVSMQMLPLKTKAEDLMLEIEKAILIVRSVFNPLCFELSIKIGISAVCQSFMWTKSKVSRSSSKSTTVLLKNAKRSTSFSYPYTNSVSKKSKLSMK